MALGEKALGEKALSGRGDRVMIDSQSGWCAAHRSNPAPRPPRSPRELSARAPAAAGWQHPAARGWARPWRLNIA
eukprot:COSAG01_NODE_13_length_41723_cov_145.394556_48_plen_75_part_00